MQLLRRTMIWKFLNFTSEFHRKNEKREWVNRNQWNFFRTYFRPFEWFLNKIVEHLTSMECQVFACCTPALELGYIWNRCWCPGVHFTKNHHFFVSNHHKIKSLKFIDLLIGWAQFCDFTSSIKFKVLIKGGNNWKMMKIRPLLQYHLKKFLV